jgi:hypothetical protein
MSRSSIESWSESKEVECRRGGVDVGRSVDVIIGMSVMEERVEWESVDERRGLDDIDWVGSEL